MTATAAGDHFWSPRADGIAIRLRLQPGASEEMIGDVIQLADGREVLVARVRAVPEKGKANKALCRMLAKRLGVAAGRVDVASGRHDRVKTVHVEGDPADLAGQVRGFGTDGNH